MRSSEGRLLRLLLVVEATGELEEETLSLKEEKDKGLLLAGQAAGGCFGDGMEGERRYCLADEEEDRSAGKEEEAIIHSALLHLCLTWWCWDILSDFGKEFYFYFHLIFFILFF